jgi:hypothetical protein
MCLVESIHNNCPGCVPIEQLLPVGQHIFDRHCTGDDFIPGRTHSWSLTADENSSTQQSKRAWVEEVEDLDAPEIGRYTQEYPGRVADTLGTEKTKFKQIREDQNMEGLEPESPFADEEEWELVKWLMKNVGQTKADDFLKLLIVSAFSPNLSIQLDRDLADTKATKFVNPQQPLAPPKS